MRLTEELKQKIVSFKKANPNYGSRTIGAHFGGIHHKTICRILRKAGLLPAVPALVATKPWKPDEPETNEIKGDTWTVTLPKTRIKSLPELLKYCEVDETIWEVERFICNKWEVGAKGKDDEIHVSPLFQVKAFLRKKKTIEAIINEIENLKKLAQEYPWPSSKIYTPKSGGLMLEINISDLHVGKLAWGVETGGPNYDVKIAEETFFKAVYGILGKVKHLEFEQVLLVIGNDMMNSDDIEGRTTAGTYVSSDGRYHKTFAVTRNMVIKAIQILKEIAPVKVLPVYGNHDQRSSWHLADSVEMFFFNDPNVTIDNRPRARKYHFFGKVFLMFTHGDKGKRQEYPLLMATEEPVAFGNALYRECHTGHTHMTKLDEQHGVRVRVLPALCPADDWHSENGYVGNLRAAEGYVWHKERGLETIVFHVEND